MSHPQEPQPPESLVGQTLCQFRILSKLGEGGMGVVYRALDTELRRVVAIKVLSGTAATDPARRGRLLREARSSAAVSHPNIATVYEVFESDGLCFIALEHVEGRTVRELVARGPLAPLDACSIARGIARALAKAHAEGVVHRDLTPDNVMVTADGFVKVLDFGLAKMHEGHGGVMATAEDGAPPPHASSLVTQDGRLIGTPAYMAPEQVAGRRTDARTDIFSLGIVLYEMLTGERPFAGDTVMAVAVAISRDTPSPPSTRNPAVCKTLDAIVFRCLAKDRSARFASCEELLAQLDAACERADVRTPKVAPPASTTGWRAPAVITLVSLLAGLAVVLAPTPPKRPAAPAPSASAVASPKPVAVTELPLPESSSPEAVAAYRAGLQAIRDGAWEMAFLEFQKAAERDPAMAAAYLRLAMTSQELRPATQTREYLQKATQLRARLSERDRALLDALEPLLQGGVKDRAEHSRRLESASLRYPGDAELLLLFGASLGRSPEEALSTSETVLALDEKYADAWQMKAHALVRLGRPDEALVALDRCLAASPGSNDCLFERIDTRVALGDCAKLEPDARRWIAKDPSSPAAYFQLARALVATSRPMEAVTEVLEQSWVRRAPNERAYARLVDLALISVLEGQFDRALEYAQGAQQAVNGDPNEQAHASPALLLTALYAEMGRDDRAAKVADGFLKRREAWVSSPAVRVTNDPVPRLLHASARGGLLSRDAAAAQLEEWIARWNPETPPSSVGELWFAAYAQTADTPDDARRALALRPKLDRREGFFESPRASGIVGEVLALAGRDREALPLLRRASTSCDALTDPFDTMRGYLHLGEVQERSGDRAAACSAYGRVLERWGDPKGRSITAEAARERALGLRCMSGPEAPAARVARAAHRPRQTPADTPMTDEDDGDESMTTEPAAPPPEPAAAAESDTPSFLVAPPAPAAPGAPLAPVGAPPRPVAPPPFLKRPTK